MFNMENGTLVYDYEGNLCVVEKECSCKCCVMLRNLNEKEYVEQRGKQFCKPISEETIVSDLGAIDKNIEYWIKRKEELIENVINFIDENIDGFGLGEKKEIFQEGDVCVNRGGAIFVVENDGFAHLKFDKDLKKDDKQGKTHVSYLKSIITMESLEGRFEKRMSFFDKEIKVLEEKKQRMLEVLGIAKDGPIQL